MAHNEMDHSWTTQLWDWPLQQNDGIAPLHNDYKGFEVELQMQVRINHIPF